MLNKIIIMGRLTRDPELRRTGSGTAVTSFSLAVDRDFKSQSGEKETDFIDVVAWRSTAEFVSKYFTKGRMAVVEGRLQIRDWTDKDGGKRRNAARKKELDAAEKRIAELSAIFKRLYEDNVLGRVTNEQKELAATIPEKKERLERLKSSMANVDAFIEKAKRYTAIDELTPELLRLFIQRIEIGEQTKKYSRSAGQSVRIVYRDIGALDTPMWEGDRAPYMAKEIAEKEEIMQLLA